MQVVVDALQYDAHPAGVGQYIAHLVAAYTARFPEDTVTAFVPAGQSLPAARCIPLIAAGAGSAHRLWVERRVLPGRIRPLAPDVVHFPDYQRPAMALGPSVLTVHDLAAFLYPETFPALTGRVKRTLMRRSMPRASRIIVPTHAIWRDLVEQLAVNPARVRVVPHGVAPPPPVDPMRAARPYLLYVGTLEPRKNLVRLLTAYGMLAQDHPDGPDLVLAGGRGWLTAPLDAARQALGRQGLGGRVSMLGYVGRDDLWRWLKGSVGFCYPSLYEGFGLPILEAMGAGVPVLTSQGGATGEVAGDAAVLVDARDVYDILRGLNELVYGGAQDRMARIAAGLKRAAQHTWVQTAEATRQVYVEAAGALG